MKYQSELIKEIVEARGHKQSSLHYESECIESWIEEAKGAYPKLCDYQSEWLNYISILDDTGGGEDIEPPIGEFPYETITDVTNATVDNVVPYAYKSAVLKGLTLVNVIGEKTDDNPMPGYSKHDFLIPLVKKNTDYLIKYDTTLSGGVIALGFLKDSSSWSNNLERQPNIGLIRLNSGEYPNYFRIVAENSQTVRINNLLIIEYQEGMENWVIPYFEGMQSVQMPVLTTSNEDGTKTNILRVNEDVTLCGIADVKDELDCLTGELTQRVSEIVLDGSDDENWVEVDRDENSVPFFQSIIKGRKGNDKLICDKLIARKDTAGDKIAVSTTVYGIMGTASGPIRIKNGATSLKDFKQWLSKNPITVQYELATESIKTVDLNIQDQNGKTLSVIKPIEGTMVLSTSSDTIKPLFSGEIPVEAITQNLASFIDLEMEE